VNLTAQLAARAKAGMPVRVALIGAGKFGSMFLSQIPTIPGLEVRVIADLDVERARAACLSVQWDLTRLARTQFTNDPISGCSTEDVDVVIEATGDPHAGIAHALAAIDASKPIVMVNVEADALAGPLLARKAREKGVVYSMAYGDQPALIAELVDWARATGFEVAAAGKGTKYLPDYHWVTPDQVWSHYGLTEEQAREAGMNARMFNSFLDGTKSALEMAAVANACDLDVPENGLAFPPCGADELPQILKSRAAGGLLERDGMVEVVSSLQRNGQPVARDIRWGVYVVIRAPNDYAAACFSQYGMNIDDTGRYAAMYRPFHLIGLELSISVLQAALNQQATGSPRCWRGDVVAVAKHLLRRGDILDGEGGYTVFGKLIPAKRSLQMNALPIGLAARAKVNREIQAGDFITFDDVSLDETTPGYRLRREMERASEILKPSESDIDVFDRL
jgi:predicted homoserine dehydrogenase-like protein